MASIKKRPNGMWRARYRDEADKEHAKHFARKTDAQKWLDEVTASVVTGTYVDPRAGAITFEQWWKQWSARQVWAEGTAESAHQAAASVTFSRIKLATLRPSHIEAWIKTMQAKPLEPTTIRTRYNYVHASLTAAVRDRVIARDPAEHTRLPRARKAEHAMTIPTAERVAKALDAAPPFFEAFVAVAAFAGLRLGEIAGLQLRDVDFLRRTIEVRRQVQGATVANRSVVPPKFGSERVVYVPEELTTILARHIEKHGTSTVEDVPGADDNDAWLFTTPAGHLYTRAAAGGQWRRTREKAGLEEFTLHDLRHFYASGLIAQKCDVVTVQRALGHAQPSITLDTYSHLWPSAEDTTRGAASAVAKTVLAARADSARTETG